MITKIITVKGAVQGVGYRPFIAEKATEYGLLGYVYNSGASVSIVARGDEDKISSFISFISHNAPAGAFVLSLEAKDFVSDEDIEDDFKEFKIIDSTTLDLSSELPVFLPDIGICPDCMREMLDKENRRYRYPLISCAVCGPRMSILNSLPYDRDNTTMEDFSMCPECASDYKKGRRRYAQTISCHDCGPQMIFKSTPCDDGADELMGDKAVQKAIALLNDGNIIGLKGISGYQLVCRPTEDAAKRLRLIKGRENKPFAVMFSDLEHVREYALVSALESKLLQSSARPIVLLNKILDFPYEVSRDSRYIGAFLPSAGIHRLLTDEAGPLIVTSANKSDQPMIYKDDEFFDTFMKCGSDAETESVDGVLYHKRRINMAQDDSVMFVISDDDSEYAQFIRRARGFAPLPIILDKRGNDDISDSSDIAVLALGGDLKSSFSFAKKDRILPSQYIGDLKDYNTSLYYDKLLKDYERIFCFKPNVLVKDMHPMYMVSKKAKDIGKKDNIKTLDLQHHFAHTYSVMAENTLECAIGVSFDGTGYGTDGKIWGGEFLLCNKKSHKRLGHLSYVKLTGGDEAAKNAENVAFCYLRASELKVLINKNQNILKAALDNNINTFESSSTGRLFDAVSSLLGVCNYNSYEGECAIMLENKALDHFNEKGDTNYPEFEFKIVQDGDMFLADQEALFADISDALDEYSDDINAVAYGFHKAVKDLIIKACILIRDKTDENKVCLSGGVFNNRLLLSLAVRDLKDNGFEVYWNQKVPLGDGGISTGQGYFGLLCGDEKQEK